MKKVGEILMRPNDSDSPPYYGSGNTEVILGNESHMFFNWEDAANFSKKQGLQIVPYSPGLLNDPAYVLNPFLFKWDLYQKERVLEKIMTKDKHSSDSSMESDCQIDDEACNHHSNSYESESESDSEEREANAKAEKLYEAGKKQEAGKNFDTAKTLYAKAHENTWDDKRKKIYKEAMTRMDQYLENEDKAENFYDQGVAAEKKENFLNAEKFYTKAYYLTTNTHNIKLSRKAWNRMIRYQEATKDGKKYYRKAKDAEKNENFALAERYFRQALAATKSSSNKIEYESCLEAIQERKKSNHYAEYFYGLATISEKKCDFEAAESLYNYAYQHSQTQRHTLFRQKNTEMKNKIGTDDTEGEKYANPDKEELDSKQTNQIISEKNTSPRTSVCKNPSQSNLFKNTEGLIKKSDFDISQIPKKNTEVSETVNPVAEQLAQKFNGSSWR